MRAGIGYHDAKGNAAWASILHQPALSESAEYPDAIPPPDEPAPETWMNRFLEWGSKKLGLCGHGAEMNWSVRFADYFFVDCGCCWFFRGVSVGLVSGAILGGCLVSLAWGLK